MSKIVYLPNIDKKSSSSSIIILGFLIGGGTFKACNAVNVEVIAESLELIGSKSKDATNFLRFYFIFLRAENKNNNQSGKSRILEMSQWLYNSIRLSEVIQHITSHRLNSFTSM